MLTLRNCGLILNPHIQERGKTLTLEIYLHFNDNCREAFEFYRSVFGGEFSIIQTMGDGPADMATPESEKDLIMHVSLPIGTGILMGSDVPSQFGPPPVTGTNFSISYVPESREEVDTLLAKLSDGGSVSMEPQDMFWGSYFASCTDKFGVGWMLNYETSAQ